MQHSQYQILQRITSQGGKSLAVLIDPDRFKIDGVSGFLKDIPSDTTYLFVGGSTVPNGETHQVVTRLKELTSLPVFLFPGDYSQITLAADVLLFLTLLSGRNAEYLIGQQVKSISKLKRSDLEIIPTGYILIDGGHESSVLRVTQTKPMNQDNIEAIVDTALAGQFLGAKLIYLEAGSGARKPVSNDIISEVKRNIAIPLIVGGGIRTDEQRQLAYKAGADIVVMGTVFEK